MSIKKMTQMIKTTLVQLVYCHLCLRLSKSVCLIKSMLTLIVFFLMYNAVLKKTAVLSIIAMIKKCRRNLDKGGICGALFMDVSKTFDCLVHDFLLARLEAYE